MTNRTEHLPVDEDLVRRSYQAEVRKSERQAALLAWALLLLLLATPAVLSVLYSWAWSQ